MITLLSRGKFSKITFVQSLISLLNSLRKLDACHVSCMRDCTLQGGLCLFCMHRLNRRQGIRDAASNDCFSLHLSNMPQEYSDSSHPTVCEFHEIGNYLSRDAYDNRFAIDYEGSSDPWHYNDRRYLGMWICVRPLELCALTRPLSPWAVYRGCIEERRICI